jgi:hypothetical protein
MSTIDGPQSTTHSPPDPDAAQMLQALVNWLTTPNGAVRNQVLPVLRTGPVEMIEMVVRALARTASSAGDEEPARQALQALVDLGYEAFNCLERGMYSGSSAARFLCVETLSRLAPQLGPVLRFRLCCHARIMGCGGKRRELAKACQRLYETLIEDLERVCKASLETRQLLYWESLYLPMMPDDPRLRAILSTELPDPALSSSSLELEVAERRRRGKPRNRRKT